jgi:hypothetical protein
MKKATAEAFWACLTHNLQGYFGLQLCKQRKRGSAANRVRHEANKSESHIVCCTPEQLK